jgi:tRNA-dihydrouridine synthase A
VGGHHLPQAPARPRTRSVTARVGPARGRTWPLSVAPMMDWTDRHYRRFVRELTRETLLYTEMVTTGALLHGDLERHLDHDPVEHPLALQLGGDDPEALARCAALGEAWGFAEIDLNVGCPSERVQRGRFGACLMLTPEAVAAAVVAMRAATALPVTVKHRLGVDDLDDDERLETFVAALVEAGVDGIVVHARKAWLSGLSPKANRSVPPLQPERVLRLKERWPGLRVELNGGIRELRSAERWLRHVDGVMIGRAAYEDPWLLAEADARIYGVAVRTVTRELALRGYLPYVEAQRERGVPLMAMARHLLGLVHGRPGARAFRRVVSEGAHLPGAGPELLERALAALPESVRREAPGAPPLHESADVAA